MKFKSIMKIRIGMDGGGLSPDNIIQSGISREVREFVKHTKKKNVLVDYYYFKDNIAAGKELVLKKTNIRFFRLPKFFFASLFLPLNLLKNKNTIFLGFSGYISPLFKLFGIKTVLFLHDFGFIKFPEHYRDNRKLKRKTINSIYRADLIIFFSKYVKNDFTRLFSDELARKTAIIYPGLDHIKKLKISDLVETKLKSEKFFLYVGVIKSIKNIDLLFNIYFDFLKKTRDNSVKLILVGLKENDYYLKLIKKPLYKKIKKQILFYEKISDDELVYFYKKAMATVNVAHEEGFCFPIFETLYLGGNAIVLNLPLYAEIAQKNSKLLICNTRKELVEKMIEIYKGKEAKKEENYHVESKYLNWQYFTNQVLNEASSLIE